jgi:hypothetical protein
MSRRGVFSNRRESHHVGHFDGNLPVEVHLLTPRVPSGKFLLARDSLGLIASNVRSLSGVTRRDNVGETRRRRFAGSLSIEP